MTLSVADRLELTDLVHRYAMYVDAQHFDGVAGLFTANGELVTANPPADLGPVVQHLGPSGVRTAMAALAGVNRTQHGIVGEVYTAGPDGTATGDITAVAHHWTEHDGGLTDLVWFLRYADRYERTDAGWRFARRALTIDAIATHPVRAVRS